MPDAPDFDAYTCPIPTSRYDRVLLAHGGGGTLMHGLIRDLFGTVFANPDLSTDHDAARLSLPGDRLAFTTDSYVVSPLEFPGGDIGSMAVHGTVNDLAMAGARPRYLSAGFILEEGLEMALLERIVRSMRAAADRAGVAIVTGDTKVVDRGKGDGVFINTAGVGQRVRDLVIGPESIAPGDAVILSGDVGRHGLAILTAREALGFEAELMSDSAAVHEPVLALLEAGIEVHCLRDLTRGGLAGALCELADASGRAVDIEGDAIPVLPATRSVGEVLGIDPIHVANEGRFAAFVPDNQREQALAILRDHEVSAGAVAIGQVRESGAGVTLITPFGARQPLHPLSGEQLPRIC